MQKVMIMNVTGDGDIEIQSITNYRETALTITPSKGYQQRIKKDHMEYVRAMNGYGAYELISRKMTYAEMKDELMQHAMRFHLSAIEHSKQVLSKLTSQL